MKTSNSSLQFSINQTATKSPLFVWAILFFSFVSFHPLAFSQYIDEDAFYELEYAGNSNYVLEVNASEFIDKSSAEVRLWERDGSDEQKFRLIDAGYGYYFIETKKRKDHVMDIYGGSSSPGAGIIIYPKHGGDNQKFKLFKSQYDGYYLMAGNHDHLCIGVEGVSKGAPVRTAWKYEEDWQQFKLRKIGGSDEPQSSSTSPTYIYNQPRPSGDTHEEHVNSQKTLVFIEHTGDFIADITVAYDDNIEDNYLPIGTEVYHKRRNGFESGSIDIPTDHVQRTQYAIVTAQIYTDFPWDSPKTISKRVLLYRGNQHKFTLSGNYHSPAIE